MGYTVHPELKSLSANLKRLDIGIFFFGKDFQYELEENNLDELWKFADETQYNNDRYFPLEINFDKYTEIFIIGLDLICRDYYNNNSTYEVTSENFTFYFNICFRYYLKKTNKIIDYSKLIKILEQNDFMDKNELNKIKNLIIEKEKKIEFEIVQSSIKEEINYIKNQDNNKKFQVFISSTFIDLIEERQAAVEAILKKGHIPAGMELFTAGDKSQWEVIKKWIDDSDIYLLILGGRYGSIDKSTGLSYTEMEYNYAVDKGKPLFSLVLDDEIIYKKSIEITKDYDVKVQKYIEFKDVVKSKMCSFLKSLDQIKIDINHSLDNLISENKEKMKGWIKGN